MNKNFCLKHLLAVSVLLSSATLANAQYSNAFDTTSSPFRYDFGNGVSPTVSWVVGPIFDAGGSSGSGSVKLGWTWAGTAGGADFTADILPTPQNYAGATLSFDIYVDPSSTPGTFNDYGYFQFNTRYTVSAGDTYHFGPSYINKGLVGAGNVASAVGQWSHVSVILGAEAATLRALTFQDYNDAGRGPINGPMALYIDNLTITPVPEPAAFALVGLGGLAMVVFRRRK